MSTIPIASLFNSNAIQCPNCKKGKGVRPNPEESKVNTPEEAWSHPFHCQACNKTYPLKQIAVRMDLFDLWFDNCFPGQPKPWENQKQITNVMESAEDWEKRMRERTHEALGRALGF